MTILIPATDPRWAAERAAAASVSTAENDVLRRVNSAHQRQGLERVEITGSIRYQYVRDAACARYLGTVGALSPLFATRDEAVAWATAWQAEKPAFREVMA